MRSSTRILVLLLVMMVVGGLGPLVAQEASGRAENDWRYLGGDPQSSQYSVLDQINEKTIGSLGLLWYSDLPIGAGLVGNPLVMGASAFVMAPLAMPPRMLCISPGTNSPSGTSLYLCNPCTNDEAQLPTPTIATLILPI